MGATGIVVRDLQMSVFQVTPLAHLASLTSLTITTKPSTLANLASLSTATIPTIAATLTSPANSSKLTNATKEKCYKYQVGGTGDSFTLRTRNGKKKEKENQEPNQRAGECSYK